MWRDYLPYRRAASRMPALSIFLADGVTRLFDALSELVDPKAIA
jgi:hypothetical protein